MPADAPMGLATATIEAAYREACLAELDALKPGNVHRFAGGHGMDVGVFEASALVSAPEIAAQGRSVGQRVLKAVEATWSAVGMNTNLGMILLCAPLAAAAEAVESLRSQHADRPANRLEAAVEDILATLSAGDAADVFHAIARASPGGLGTDAEHDVRAAPTIPLAEAMRIAAPRDLVARQYATGFADIFDVGLPALDASRAAGEDGMWPVIRCFFAFATRFPDSHVARKFGDDAAEDLRRRFLGVGKHLNSIVNPAQRQAALLDLDRGLKAEGLNPGTSADLTVASIFAAGLARELEQVGRG